MLFKRTDKKGLLLWEIRLTLIAFSVSVLTAMILGGILFKIISAVWMIGYIVAGAWYYPLKYRKLSYNFDDKLLVVNCGVIYRRRKSIFLKNVQYISTMATPLQRLMGLKTIVVHAAGGLIFIPNLNKSEANAFELFERG